MRRALGFLLVVLLILGTSSILSANRVTPTNSVEKAKGNKATISVLDMVGGVTALNLVNSILGGGLEASNIVYTGAPVAAGTFSGGLGAGIGINSGIILSTGAALNAVGPNASDATSYISDLPGDADLSLLIGAITNDACVLEFDFIPQTANFQFTFVMGSEEYEEYVEYADAFAFYLNGVNIALLPGTATPISIGTVNQDVNSAYYVSNYPFPGTYDIECDGFTIPISLNATVTPNVVNHIKLAVADYSDTAYDTWIFINGESLASGFNVNVASDPTGALIYKDGISTGLLTPNTIVQATGTTSVYSVEKAGYAFPTETVSNITSDQSFTLTGTAELIIVPEDVAVIIAGTGLPEGVLETDPNLSGYTATYPEDGTQTVSIPVGAGVWRGWIYYTFAWHEADVFPVNGPGFVVFSNVPFTGGKSEMPIILKGEDAPLPVELSAFTAVLNAENYVNIQWVTQTETNLTGFYLYRSATGYITDALQLTQLIYPTNTSQQHQYNQVDITLEEEGIYYYWLQVVEMDGTVVFHGPTAVEFSFHADEPQVTPVTPITGISSIYPNPITPYSVISYNVVKGADVKFQVFNTRGQLVNSFSEGFKLDGKWSTNWNGKDSNGNQCPAGIYYIKMMAGNDSFTRKAVILK